MRWRYRRLMLTTATLVAQNTRAPRDAALVYAEAGWPIFPVAGIVARRCGCRHGAGCAHPAKHPLVPGGARSASTERAQVRDWWDRWPWAGVGLVTGARSGLVVVDLDPAHGAERTVASLHEQGIDLPPTLAVTTGGGGHHLVYAHPGCTMPNSAGELPGVGLTPGVDLRGDGGYVVAAPSVHRSGNRYRWEGGDLASLPPWFRPTAPPVTPSAIPTLNADRQQGYVETALASEVARVRQAVPHDQGGQGRNDTLNKSAFAVGTLVGAGVLDSDRARYALLEAATSSGLSVAEADRTITSGLQAGAARPRSLPAFGSHEAPPGRHGLSVDRPTPSKR